MVTFDEKQKTRKTKELRTAFFVRTGLKSQVEVVLVESSNSRVLARQAYAHSLIRTVVLYLLFFASSFIDSTRLD